jgi:hypothetical protein
LAFYGRFYLENLAKIENKHLKEGLARKDLNMKKVIKE